MHCSGKAKHEDEVKDLRDCGFRSYRVERSPPPTRREVWASSMRLLSHEPKTNLEPMSTVSRADH